MTESTLQPVRVFCSYSHKDAKLRERLDAQFAVMRANGEVTLWHDGLINAGAEWDAEIKQALAEAEVVLLLVSPSFFNSWYCAAVELNEALARHKAGTARVIPVVLRLCDFGASPVKHLKALPRDAQPIVHRSTVREDRLQEVVEGVRAVVRAMRKPGNGR